MATKKKTARVCVTFEDGDRFCTTRKAFLDDNWEDSRLASRVKKLKVGESAREGGGAGIGFTVKRTR